MTQIADNELAEVGIKLGRDWLDYHKKLKRTSDPEMFVWAKMRDAIVLAGLWLREKLGQDIIREDNEGKQWIVKSYPYYKMLFIAGTLEYRPLKGYIASDYQYGYISESTINRLDQHRVPAKTLVTVEVIDVEKEIGTSAQAVSD